MTKRGVKGIRPLDCFPLWGREGVRLTPLQNKKIDVQGISPELKFPATFTLKKISSVKREMKYSPDHTISSKCISAIDARRTPLTYRSKLMRISGCATNFP